MFATWSKNWHEMSLFSEFNWCFHGNHEKARLSRHEEFLWKLGLDCCFLELQFVSLELAAVVVTFFQYGKHMAFICYQPTDSALGFSERILTAARNIRVFNGRIHVSVQMTELLVPNNLENIFMSNNRYNVRFNSLKVVLYIFLIIYTLYQWIKAVLSMGNVCRFFSRKY